MKVRYFKNLHVVQAESDNDLIKRNENCVELFQRFCLSVNVLYHMIPKYDINKEIKRAAVAKGYIEAFKNFFKKKYNNNSLYNQTILESRHDNSFASDFLFIMQ
tara:strand:- start:239 stop:550 length:312 start_codon:yes stop_codon:yes gene_type:complete